jgi:hypothetical protein
MDFDQCIDARNMDKALEWGVKFDKERQTGLLQWLSSFRNYRHCEVLTTILWRLQLVL